MHSTAETLTRPRLGVVGAGRLGPALASALRAAGYPVAGPAGRGERPLDCEAILVCVPDAEIPAAAEALAGAAPLLGHTSGATPLAALEPSGAAALFGLHPLQSFAGAASRSAFRGAGCAVAGLKAPDARALLTPLVLQSARNWSELGPERALTGPVSRDDEATVATQRAAVEEHAPELLALFDELVERTRELAGREVTA